MNELKIKDVQFIDQKKGRKIIVRIKEGNIVHKVTIEPCYESWQQYGAPQEVLKRTVPIAEKYNDWLHGID